MYAETGILFPFFQNLDQETQLLEDFCNFHGASPSLTSAISEYDIEEHFLGGEEGIFEAPEPVIEELPMSAISCFKPSDIELFQSEQLLSELLKDLFEEAARDSPLPGGQFQKSVSSECLSEMEPGFLDFSGIDFGTVYGMRKAYSEGDIKTLGNGSENCNKSTNQSSTLQRSLITTREERREKLSRYRIKKTKRNFGRKIKYACRKALADSQPRIRGRFARTEESEIPKRQCLN